MALVADSGFRRSLGTGKSLSFVSSWPTCALPERLTELALGGVLLAAALAMVMRRAGVLGVERIDQLHDEVKSAALGRRSA